jgi:predicted acylesterase/phospholipase RssA
MNARSSTGVLERREEIEAPLDPRLYTTLKRLASDEGHRFVVSLGGGSVPGISGNIALVRILEELGLREHVEEVWGTSAGATVGGAWASGTDALSIMKGVASLHRRGSVDILWFRMAISMLLRPLGVPLMDGVLKGDSFKATIEACQKVKTFEECDPPFRCIACSDDGAARRKIFRRGRLTPAIFSSMSIPGIVIPREKIGDELCHYYDGGLVEKTPLISPISEHSRMGDKRQLLLLGTHFGNDAKRTTAVGFINRFIYSLCALESLASRLERNYLHARETFADVLQNAKLALSFGET